MTLTQRSTEIQETRTVEAHYVNSEGDEIKIMVCRKAPFEGRPLLVMPDDPENTDTKAVMLLDEGTQHFLMRMISDLRCRGMG